MPAATQPIKKTTLRSDLALGGVIATTQRSGGLLRDTEATSGDDLCNSSEPGGHKNYVRPYSTQW